MRSRGYRVKVEATCCPEVRMSSWQGVGLVPTRFTLSARLSSHHRQVRESSRSGRVLGFCMLHVAASKDGCSLFWALGRNGAPLALRWQPGLGPWKVGAVMGGNF